MVPKLYVFLLQRKFINNTEKFKSKQAYKDAWTHLSIWRVLIVLNIIFLKLCVMKIIILSSFKLARQEFPCVGNSFCKLLGHMHLELKNHSLFAMWIFISLIYLLHLFILFIQFRHNSIGWFSLMQWPVVWLLTAMMLSPNRGPCTHKQHINFELITSGQSEASSSKDTTFSHTLKWDHTSFQTKVRILQK